MSVSLRGLLSPALYPLACTSDSSTGGWMVGSIWPVAFFHINCVLQHYGYWWNLGAIFNLGKWKLTNNDCWLLPGWTVLGGSLYLSLEALVSRAVTSVMHLDVGFPSFPASLFLHSHHCFLGSSPPGHVGSTHGGLCSREFKLTQLLFNNTDTPIMAKASVWK